MGACYAGNMTIVQDMIRRGANYWTSGLIRVCEGSFRLDKSHLEIAKLLIAKIDSLTVNYDYTYYLYDVCYQGNMALVQLFLSLMPDYVDHALRGASRKNSNTHIVQFLIDRGADPNEGMCNACTDNHHDILKLLIARGATKCRCGKSMQQHLGKN